MSTMHDSRRSPDTRPVLLRRQGRPAPSCGPGSAPRPPVTRHPPSAVAIASRPPRFTSRLATVLGWIAEHPQVRCDINIPAGSRSGVNVGLRLDGQALRICYLVRADDPDDLVTKRLDELLNRLRISARSEQRQ